MLRTFARPITLAVAVLMALAVPSFARTLSTLNGTVVTVSPAAHAVSVATANGRVTLTVGRSTRLSRNGAAVSLPSLAARDSVQARFDTRTKIALSLAARGPALVTVRGRVAGVNGAGQGITLASPSGSRSFAVAPQTIVNRNGERSSLSRITLRDSVTVHVAAGSTSSTAMDVEADGPEEAEVEGTISAINGTDVTIHPQHGTDVTVHTGSSTLITRDDASATLADLAVGQRAEAEYDPVSFNAFSIRAESAETEHQHVAGTVASVDTTAMTLTINPANGGTAVTLNVKSSTEITRDGETATLSQIVQGDRVRAEFDGSMNALQIEAERQEQGNAEIEGTASNVSATGLTVTPEHGPPVTLTINAQTEIELGDDHPGTAADLHNGDRVSVRFDPTTMTALRIEDEGQENPPQTTAEIEGTASNVSATAITVTPEEGSAVTLTINSSTRISRDDHSGTAADIHDGDRVQVRYDTSTMVALEIEVDSQGHD